MLKPRPDQAVPLDRPMMKDLCDLVVIRPEHAFGGIGLAELWQFRRLLYWLAWRDIRVRYAHMQVGLVWALLQPAALVVVLSVALGSLARVPSDGGVPYPVFVLVGIVVWTVFSGLVSSVASGLARNAPLLSKVYCSRLAVTLSAAGAPLADIAALFGAVVVAAVAFGVTLQPTALLALGFVLWSGLLGCALGLLFAALSVRFADATAVLPIVLQIGMFASPVMYPASIVPAGIRFIYDLNPIAAILSGARWGLYGGPAPSWYSLAAAAVVTITLCLVALAYFSRIERTLADLL
jgi:lipopolysaccharide transport system permease protein